MPTPIEKRDVSADVLEDRSTLGCTNLLDGLAGSLLDALIHSLAMVRMTERR